MQPNKVLQAPINSIAREESTSQITKENISLIPYNISDSNTNQKDASLVISASNTSTCPQPCIVLNTLPKKVSLEEWKNSADQLLKETYMLVVNKMGNASTIQNIVSTQYEPIYSKYYGIYQMISTNNKNFLKKVQKDFKKELLNPLGNFVAIFESHFDALKSHYQKNSSDYIKDKNRLEKQIFPTVQKTFNTFMEIYEQYAEEQLGIIGPLKYQSENFSVYSENVTKHIFYKRDINNNFLLFALYPHQKSELGENLYKSYVPYVQARNEEYIQDTIVFSLDSNKNPMIVPNSGYFVAKRDYGYLIEPYRGSTTSLPYTTLQSLVILHENAQKKIDNFSKTPVSIEQENIASNEQEKREFNEHEATKSNLNSAPADLKGKIIFSRPQVDVPDDLAKIINVFFQNLLKNNDEVFIAFPYTEREQIEETYLFLLEVQQRLASPQDIQSGDRLFLEYLENTAFPEQKLDQVIQAYEEALIDDYTKEEEKIRLEQEAISRMVATGEFYKKSEKTTKTSQKKKKSQKKHAAMKGEVKEPAPSEKVINKNDTPIESPTEKARRKLKELKEANKNGSVKFRKFMQLVNIARQGLEQMDLVPQVELHKSSHGSIQIEGTTPQAIVRPHGGAKEKSISSISKKKILSDLVQAMMIKLSNIPS